MTPQTTAAQYTELADTIDNILRGNLCQAADTRSALREAATQADTIAKLQAECDGLRDMLHDVMDQCTMHQLQLCNARKDIETKNDALRTLCRVYLGPEGRVLAEQALAQETKLATHKDK
jgi:TRAP-type mannitol/chloroaromatic compound transport system substrate-binding protein